METQTVLKAILYDLQNMLDTRRRITGYRSVGINKALDEEFNQGIEYSMAVVEKHLVVYCHTCKEKEKAERSQSNDYFGITREPIKEKIRER